jgi:hypothetical protein
MILGSGTCLHEEEVAMRRPTAIETMGGGVVKASINDDDENTARATPTAAMKGAIVVRSLTAASISIDGRWTDETAKLKIIDDGIERSKIER